MVSEISIARHYSRLMDRAMGHGSADPRPRGAMAGMIAMCRFMSCYRGKRGGGRWHGGSRCLPNYASASRDKDVSAKVPLRAPSAGFEDPSWSTGINIPPVDSVLSKVVRGRGGFGGAIQLHSQIRASHAMEEVCLRQTTT